MDPGVIALFIPIVALMIPIVRMLTIHQQKMAEIVHNQAPNPAIEDMRRELYELRNLVNQQALVIDNLDTRVRALPVSRTTTSP